MEAPRQFVPLKMVNSGLFSKMPSVPLFIGNSTPVSPGPFSNCTVGAASDTIQHADIDTNTAIGDLVQVVSGTGVTAGFYRITAVGANQVTVDRNISGAGGTDVLCAVYKDIIGFFITDATNGQRVMNYSHQNKPLQLGGDIPAATGHSLTSEDIIFGGDVEFDEPVYFDSIAQISYVPAETKTDTYSITTGDFGKSLRMNSASDKIFNLPSVGATEDGARITLIKIGAGKVTIQAADADLIHSGTAGGTMYNDIPAETYARIELEYCHATLTWNVLASGTWATT